MRFLLSVSMILSCLFLFSPIVKADNLDAAIKKKGPELVKALQDMGVKKVGVLRFRIQEGKRAESFQVSNLNSEIATILENSLVLSFEKDNPAFLLTKDTSYVAALGKVGKWFETLTERKKLFDLEYPAAWGKEKIKPDAFITGVLKLPVDLKKATLVLEIIKKKEPNKIEKWSELSFDTDAGLIANLGHSFNVVKRGSSNSKKPIKRETSDDFAIEEGTSQNNNLSSSTSLSSSVTSLSDIGGIEFKMLAGGQEVSPTPPSGDTEWTMECPEASKKISFSIKNNSDKELGVLIRLNGQNLIKVDEKESRKFLRGPGASTLINGFVYSKEDIKPFKILVGEQAENKKDELGPRAGYIDIEVYESSGGGGASGGDVTISSYNIRSRSVPSDRYRADLSSLQSHLASKNLMKSVTREKKNADGIRKYEIIVPDEAAIEKAMINEKEFPNPVIRASVSLKLLPRSSSSSSTDE